MLPIIFKTMPFFALIGVGYLAGRTRFFTDEATAWLTKFVFYFALSAMIFRFAATLSLTEIYSTGFVLAYLTGCLFVYAVAMAAAFWRQVGAAEAAVEAQCAVVGNTGFLGAPMFVTLLGPAAAGPVLMVLAIDTIVFTSVMTMIITTARQGRISPGSVRTLVVSLAKNPMVTSMAAGLLWSVTGLGLAPPVEDFLLLLGAAATPGALFAIGASLASKSTERMAVAVWLSFCKLVLHPLGVAIAALWIFAVEPLAASVMIAAASLPVAGNIYILAQHFGVAPQRVSASILISTALSIVTVTLIIGLVFSQGAIE